MLAQFSHWPLDEPHLSKDVALIADILEQRGVRFEVQPMATAVEGEWDDVMSAIHACHEALRREHARVLTTIMVDDDAGRALNMAEATDKVRARRLEARRDAGEDSSVRDEA